MTETATPATSSTTTATPGAVSIATTVSPGWRTSEFWLTLTTQVVGSLIAGEVFAPASTPAKIAAVAMMVLTALGYQYSRTTVKNAAVAS